MRQNRCSRETVRFCHGFGGWQKSDAQFLPLFLAMSWVNSSFCPQKWVTMVAANEIGSLSFFCPLRRLLNREQHAASENHGASSCQGWLFPAKSCTSRSSFSFPTKNAACTALCTTCRKERLTILLLYSRWQGGGSEAAIRAAGYSHCCLSLTPVYILPRGFSSQICC